MAKPKLALIPAAQGTKFYSVLPSNGTGDFDFTRGSVATRINAQGLIENVASGQSRLDYPMIDGVQKGCPHHILEPARTNLVTYSEDFSNAYWANTEATTVNTNVAVSPDGASNADKLIPQATSAFHRLSKTFSVTPSTPYVFTAFVKRAGYNYFLIRASDTANNNIGFDLVNGTVTYTASGYSAFIEPYGNDWYRVGFVRSFTASSMTINFRSDSNIVNDNNITTFTGNGTSGVYIWGTQLEQGSYPTSYIPTNGTAVTRSAETASGAGNSTTFNDSEGVLMFEGSNISENNSTTISIGLSDGSLSNSISLYYFGASGLYYDIFNPSGTRSGNIPMAKLQQANNNKIALKYKSQDISLFVNGFELLTNSGTLSLNGLSEVSLDYGNGAFPFYGNTKQIQYFDTILDSQQLEQLTSWTSFTDMANGQLYTIE